ncbi:MAG: PHB depolymerase family esterase [Candidatus Acidiferrales bacterium]
MEILRKFKVFFVVSAAGVLIFGLLAMAVIRRGGQDASRPGNAPGTIELGGRTRTYFVHVPPGYDGQKALPLVLVLHGGMGSSEGVESLSGMSVKADKEGFLVAYPNGTGRLFTWNSGNCCGSAMQNNVDDVGFLSALIDKLERDYAVNPKRVYVTGISNGGMMTYRLACELADKIAAIAPVEGAQNVDCRPSAPVSVIVFHGTADGLVPFGGGASPFQIGPRRRDTSVAQAVSFWVNEDGCSPAPEHEETSAVHIDTYSGCKNGTAVVLYAIQGGRHKWPGHRFSGTTVSATDLMWSFFAQHPKP